MKKMRTVTLFKYIRSELLRKGLNEFTNEAGELVFYDKDYQFITKIMRYDEDVSNIIDDLFYQLHLDDRDSDYHFKKTFTLRFLNRQINRQTIDSFRIELMNAFLTKEHYLNQLYNDLDQYILSVNKTDQQNRQKNDGTTISDNRQANAELPQSTVNLDLDNTIMETADDNTVARNKQRNNQETDGETMTENKSYQLDQLIKSSQLMEELLNYFDRKCFLQVH